MRVVWKYVLDVKGEQEIEMPYGAEVRLLAAQADELCLWVEVDTDRTKVRRTFYVFGTGHPLPDEPIRHLGSVLMFGGSLVWHVYEPEYSQVLVGH